MHFRRSTLVYGPTQAQSHESWYLAQDALRGNICYNRDVRSIIFNSCILPTAFKRRGYCPPELVAQKRAGPEQDRKLLASLALML